MGEMRGHTHSEKSYVSEPQRLKELRNFKLKFQLKLAVAVHAAS